ASTWRQLFRIYTGTDQESAEIRASLFQWMVLQTPHVGSANVAAAFVLAAILPADVEPWLRWSWFGAICVAWVPAFADWLRHRHRPPTQRRPTIVLVSVL